MTMSTAAMTYDFTVEWNPNTNRFEGVGRPQDSGDPKLIVSRSSLTLAEVQVALETAAKDALKVYQAPISWTVYIDASKP